MSSRREIPSRAHVASEASNPRTAHLDQLELRDALALVQAEDAQLPAALAAASESIARAIERIAERLARGGRLFYVGAGTSGRLGVLDAVECPPTFQSSPEQVQALLAGGAGAMFQAVEGAEDSTQAASVELRLKELRERDVVFGITASGTTPYVHGALRYARECGAASILLACVPFENAPDEADISIRVHTGPEVLTGSTRMKAGSATKMVLNSISTLVMLRLGKVHGNRMVDVNTSGNIKLLDRGIRLVSELCELDRDAAARLLEAAQGRVKLAVVMHVREVDAHAAEALLHDAGGHLRIALRSPAQP